ALLAAPAGAAATTPTADSYVRSDQPSANFGTSVHLFAETGSPARHAYLRFDPQVPAGDVVTKATLRIFSLAAAGGDSVALHGVADDTWSETGITWDNAPAFDAADADT